jgi:hypothetical protein
MLGGMSEEFKPEEIQPNQENLEGIDEQVALEKLEKLQNPDFKDYVLRLVSLDEYKKIIGGKLKGGKEVYVPDISFEEYKNNFLDTEDRYGWDQHIHWQAEWDKSAEGLETHSHMIEILKKCHEQAKVLLKESSEKVSVREKTIELFKEAIKNDQGLSHERIAHRVLKEHAKREGEKFSPQAHKRIKTASDLDNDEYWDEEEVLREVIQSFTHSRDDLKKTVLKQPELSDYHIEIILDKRVSGKHSLQDGWGYISTQIEGKDILGAIVIINDRSIVSEVMSTTKSTSDYTHPIFDSHFNVRYPIK